MSELYNKIEYLCQERGTDITKMCRELKIPRSSFSELKSGRSKSIAADKLVLVANYFNVSTDFLLGKQDIILGTEIRKIIKQIANELGESYDELEKLYMTKEFPRAISYKSLLYFFSAYLDKPLCIGDNNSQSNPLSEREEYLITNYRQLNEEGKDKADEYIEDLLGMKRVYRAARSADNHPAEITVLTKEEQERIEKAPRVTSENSDL